MAEKLSFGKSDYVLKLGKSFDKDNSVAFHSFRYDFKPASVDAKNDSTVTIGKDNSVSVTVPHIDGAVTSHTLYKGNKRPCPKECVLLFDHNTGEVTLERLSNNVQLKKTRIDGSSKAPLHGRPVTPADQRVTKASKKQPNAKTDLVPSKSPPKTEERTAAPQEKLSSDDGSGSSSSFSSSDSSSDSDSDNNQKKDRTSSGTHSQNRPYQAHGLSEDLQLSESDSDND